MATIDILYFASLREGLGTGRERIELPAQVTTAAHLRAWLRQRGGAWAALLADTRSVRIAVDQVVAGGDTALAGAREVAFFPPVTGG